MQHGKHCSSKQKRRWKPVLLTAGILLLVLCAVVSTVAWITVRDRAENRFTVGTAAAQVQETFPEPYTKKSDVKIKNTGDIPAYVRVAVSIYWQTQDGMILPDAPTEGEDYTIVWGSSSNWAQQDGLYYYLLPLEPGAVSDSLIDSCEQIGTVEDGKHLAVDISVQVIQAEPADAVQEAWGVQTAADGTLVPGTTP